jgi:translation initiation factor IF-2
MQDAKKKQNTLMIERPPIIVVMGHIDHGKSKLLDYIRKTNIVDTETGGITQHISAYEMLHKNQNGDDKRITFLDTPGHEAFSSMRSHGAKVADIAILVVSAEDGVKAQTLEALKAIKEGDIPYIVAINKIDKPGANVEKTKQDLSENGIYIEGYGGDIPFVPISAKEGTGVSELLDMMLLVADMEELKADPSVNAEGVIIESHVDPKKGTSASLIITNGTLKKGMCIGIGETCSPVRIIEDFLGKKIDEATFSSPIRITGFDKVPRSGFPFSSFKTKKEAEEEASKYESPPRVQKIIGSENAKVIIPVVLKADALGTLDAIEKELQKTVSEKVSIKIIYRGVGDITENDIKSASGSSDTIVIGFRVHIDSEAISFAEKNEIPVHSFGIIYNITDYIEDEVKKRTPKEKIQEETGEIKILRIFSKTKDRQVIGGKVLKGFITSGANISIERRGTAIAEGKVIELQQQKIKTDKVEEGLEFGVTIESKMEIAEGDYIKPFIIVTK